MPRSRLLVHGMFQRRWVGLGDFDAPRHLSMLPAHVVRNVVGNLTGKCWHPSHYDHSDRTKTDLAVVFNANERCQLQNAANRIARCVESVSNKKGSLFRSE